MVRMFLGDYTAYYIYSCSPSRMLASKSQLTAFRMEPVDELAIRSSPDVLIRKQIRYAGSDSYAYACFEGNRIVSICFYWFGKRYLNRNFWPLVDGEAKLVQIITLPEMRGRGIAISLMVSSYQAMCEKGFDRVYSRIWFSNTSSLQAFRRAGWSKVALVIEFNPLRLYRSVRLRFNFKVLGVFGKWGDK